VAAELPPDAAGSVLVVAKLPYRHARSAPAVASVTPSTREAGAATDGAGVLTATSSTEGAEGPAAAAKADGSTITVVAAVGCAAREATFLNGRTRTAAPTTVAGTVVVDTVMRGGGRGEGRSAVACEPVERASQRKGVAGEREEIGRCERGGAARMRRKEEQESVAASRPIPNKTSRRGGTATGAQHGHKRSC